MEKNKKEKSKVVISEGVELTKKMDDIKKTLVIPALYGRKLHTDSIITLGQKIEPLLKVQESIAGSISALTDYAKIGMISNKELESITENVASVSDSLSSLNKIAATSGAIYSKLGDPLVANPVTSLLEISGQSIALHQGAIAGALKGISSGIRQSINPSLLRASESLALNKLAIDSLRESQVLFPSVVSVSEESKEEKRIMKLEEEIEKIKAEKREKIETKFTEKIKKLLKGIDRELYERFSGSHDVIGQNDDWIAHSAESMTRLIESLPQFLSPKHIPTSKKKEDIAKELLTVYLKKKPDILKKYLVGQQHYFYTIFSEIRHRNPKIYPFYKKDPVLYNALLLKSECFLYELLN